MRAEQPWMQATATDALACVHLLRVGGPCALLQLDPLCARALVMFAWRHT